MEVNRTEESQQFDYHELLNIKKDNIKILGFAQTEQTWRVNAKTGIFVEWRQQIINETFAEEAYSFGISMINQFVKNLQSESNSQLQTLSQFMQKIESNWQMICRFPDLLEFTELLQYKQDQSMKAIFDSTYSKQLLDSKMQIRKKIQDQILEQKHKSLELFQQIEIEQKQFVLQEKSKIKTEVEQSLQSFKQENKIQNKIYKKYQKLLDEQLYTNECHYNLIIFDEIKKHEREYQQKKGFVQLDEFVARISSDAQKLQEFKSNKELIEQNFLKIWNNILDQSREQQEKVFQNFSQTQYQAIYASFQQYQFNSNDHQSYLYYFLELSKKPPDIGNQQIEKEDILKNYQKEIKNYLPLQIILQKTRNILIYFISQLQKEQRKSDLHPYILGTLFLSDYYNFFWNLNKLGSNSYQNHLNKSISNFFSILQICNITYVKEKYESLKKYLLTYSEWQIFRSSPEHYFKSLQSNFSFAKGSNFIFNEEFTQNLKFYYPQLKVQEKTLYGRSLNEVKAWCEEQKHQYFFFLKQCYHSKNYVQFSTILSYIADLQPYNQSNFQNNVLSWFEQTMVSQKGWEKVYFQIYDIVRQKMTKKNTSEYSNSKNFENEEILSSDNYLNTQIISTIKQKIFEYNNQFANLGVILSQLGERCIYYYSTFLILRFSCYSKWKQLEENHRKLEQMKQEQLDKFLADLEQNKTAQSVLHAQVLAKNIKLAFLDIFYQEQQQIVNTNINSINLSCSQVVSILDSKLLQNYQTAKAKNILDEDIFEYIMDQKSYIEKYTENFIKSKEEEVKSSQQKILKQQLQIFSKQVLNNIFQIQCITQKYQSQLKSEDFFDPQSIDSAKEDCDRLLFLLISKCIQGEQLSKESLSVVNVDLREIFEQSFEKIQIPIFTKFENDSEKKIPQLKPFIQQFYKVFQQETQNKNTEPLIWKNFNTQETLNKQKLCMIGCQFSCPMCRRKCDRPDDQNHRHSCSNGHQYRGMNGVLINNTPSLLICEEINDNALITTLETSLQRKWKTIKNAYPEWNFNSVNDEKIIQLQEKMKEIWNSGTGELICQGLTKKFNKEIKFKKGEGFDLQILQEAIHYIFMLDDSGSMNGQKWELAKKGAIQCMKDISKNGDAKVSVIIFNSNARVVIDCQKVDIDQQQDLLKFQNGVTSFNQAFLTAFDQIVKHAQKQFEKNLILFYTDGGDSYPKEAIEKFSTLPQDLRQTIKLYSCADGKENITLQQITQQIQKYGIEAELRQNITVQALGAIWTEVVSQNYHQLKG